MEASAKKALPAFFCLDSRRDKGRIVVPCNVCRNAEAGQKSKQDWMIIYFRGPKVKFLVRIRVEISKLEGNLHFFKQENR